MDINLILHLQINISSFILSIILLAHNYHRKNQIIGKSFFSVCTAMIMTVSVINIVVWLLEGELFKGSYWLYYIFISLELMCMVISCSCIFLYSLAGEKRLSKIRLIIISLIPILIEIVLIIVNIYHPILFVIDKATNIHKRIYPTFLVSALIPWAYVVYGIVYCFIKYVKSKFTDITYLHLIVFQVLGIFGSIFHLLFREIESLWTLILYGLVYAYITVQSKRADEVEKSINDTKVSIMLSQIKPHFLYNMFTTIMVLCDDDPQIAKKALGEFAVYLRGNMDSLSCDRPIPFNQELEHVKKYIYLETLRFGDRLNVEFDINETDFDVPALSLQPLVENAVKYGIGAKMEGGTIKISSFKDDEYYYISIQDDGVGMNVDRIEDIPIKDDGRTHIGIQNVNRRIKEMSNGSLSISSKLGEGSVVTIKVPVAKEAK